MFRQFGLDNRHTSSMQPPPVSAPDPAADAFPPVQEDRKLSEWLDLKRQLHEVLLERLNLSVIDKIIPTELRREVSILVSDYLRQQNKNLPDDEITRLVGELMDEVLGLGPLEALLSDPTVNDILVNGPHDVYVERYGKLEKTRTRFRDEKHLLRVIDRVVSRVGRRIDESNPWVDARLEDGSRFNAIIRPCAIDGPSISIRKFSRSPLTMDLLVQHGALSAGAAELLAGLVRARKNVLISGGTGSGKTTMLNAMSASIAPSERVVTIEDAAELQLQQPHVVRLETRPANPNGEGAVNQRELVRNALRMRPDRIIVGEVRGAESFDMLQAMNTGHDGSMTTVHANTARDALARIEQMVTMIGMDFPLSAIRSQVASGLQFVVHLARMSDGRRRVTNVAEITGVEGSTITMQDIFVFRRSGIGKNGEVLGDFVPTGIRPRHFDDLVIAGINLRPDSFVVKG